MLRRPEIQAHHVDEFFDESLVAAELERPDAMRLEFVRPPDAFDHRLVDAQMGGQGARAPVRGVLRQAVQRGLHNGAGPAPALGRFASASAAFLRDALQSFGRKTIAPSPHNRAFDPQFLGDLKVGLPVGGSQDDLRPRRLPRGNRPTARPRRQHSALWVRQRDYNRSTHGSHPPSKDETRQANIGCS